mmetsp:Transcript_14535/g.16064  ORF Transcript_14535/g.16064 Transcript_14535/m.16064 type:complete len:105 (-) Transcript_14535:476-790(-)|eukprot:CAMPEP_0114974218 /NCGR_PEP_ID=MMETSP0216-20121206/1396_1 /TAXON_ID=223996 /ORGANISM="Protocruzia adherens, Strain Boccale" /LENGTH=104 /DNA_ID=CAMNT_0002334813 /DNA_START=54 /DNA_END=368 /DNA_ORIENTATION=+
MAYVKLAILTCLTLGAFFYIQLPKNKEPEPDYYAILGISSEATHTQVKKAYRKQAMTWHPDGRHSFEPDQEQKFNQIMRAYEVLSDPEQRELYDQRRAVKTEDA